jgi:hypothetical protein
MKGKVILVAVLWTVFVFTASAVWHMFSRPVDYMAFMFWGVVIALSFMPAVIASYGLAQFIVNGDDCDPERYPTIDEQLDDYRERRADTGVVFYDGATFFLFGLEDDVEDCWWVELVDDSEGTLAVMDRCTFRSRAAAFMWIERTAFVYLDGNTEMDHLRRNLQVV